MRREFPAKVKEAAFERSEGNCEHCGLPFAGERPEYHHVLECGFGGEPTLDNCLAVHKRCHRRITSTQSVPLIAKADRVKRKAAGIKRKHKWPQRRFGQ